MALFPRLFASEFVPMFRLLDDYAAHAVSRGNACGTTFVTTKRFFQPRFDVKESKDSYELHGELPGINQKDINIEFIDPQTLSIKGRTETHLEKGTRPSESVEPAAAKEQPGAATSETPTSTHYRKPSIEEENATGDFVNIESPTNAQATEAPADEAQQVAPTPKDQAYSRSWLSERSIGEFSRTFAFPARVDQDQVRASLKDGILSIIVPKAAAPALRRINIE